MTTPQLVAALLPVLGVTAACAGLLWALERELPLSGAVDENALHADTRDAVSWISGTAILLLAAAALLSPVVAIIRGDVPSPLNALLVGRHRRRLETLQAAGLDHPGRITARDAFHEVIERIGAPGPLHDIVEEILGSPGASSREPPEEITRVWWMFEDWLRRHVGGEAGYLLVRLRQEFEILRGGRENRVELIYPSSEHDVRATQLGNVWPAAVDRVQQRTGLDLEAAGPRLRALMTPAELQMLDGYRRRESVMTAATAGWGMAAVISAGVFVAHPNVSWLLAVLPLASLAIMRSAYRTAFAAALDGGLTLESAVDVHRDELLEALGLSRTAGDEEARSAFRRFSDELAEAKGDRVLADVLGAGAADEVSSRVRRAVDDAIAGLPSRIGPSIVSSVEQAMDVGMKTRLAPALTETLRDAVAGPELTNYAGHVSVAVQDGDGSVVLSDRRLSLRPGRTYRLVVAIGPEPRGNISAPLRITGGRDAREVAFGVSLDSDARELRADEQQAIVDSDGGTEELLFELGPTGEWHSPRWIWVSVTQQGYTVQSLELHTAAEGTAA